MKRNTAMNKKDSQRQRLAFYLLGENVMPLAPAIDVTDIMDLPDTLVIPPGVYRVHEQVYRMEQEGLYRFLCPKNKNLQCVVYKNDITAFISAMCWIHSHGSRDDKKTFKELAETAKTGKLIMTCGPYSNFTARLCEKYGIPARAVGTRTMEQHNSFDTGHILLEVYTGERWVLYDVDLHVFYLHQSRHLNLLEAVKQIQKDDYKMEYLSNSVNLAVGSFYAEGGYDFGLWMETNFCSEVNVRRWLRRVMGIPFIGDKEKGCYMTTCLESNKERVKQAWSELVWLPESKFCQQFYEVKQ